MTDKEIKVMFSREILVMQDKAKEDTLRYILFATKNEINWQEAYEVAINNMPELKNYKNE